MTGDLREQLGNIDIYWFDQLLRGRIEPDARILDAGCGGGRNLRYLLRAGYDVRGVDQDPARVAATQALAASLGDVDPDRFQVAPVESLPFPDDDFDVVLCNAVLHFARDEAHFLAMIDELGRVLAPGGLLFTRLASRTGIEDRVKPLGAGRFRLPDGSDRFLVDEPMLLSLTDRLGGRLADPIKTTNVQGLRCMTTWCVRIAAR